MNGGEPTLWEEGDRKFIDVALAIAEGGIHPTFNTNGSYFVDYHQCYGFFHRFAEEGKLPLMTYVSIDKFHDNYDRERGRADSLDNMKKVLDEMPANKRAMHRVHVITIISKDPNSFLPEEMKEYYGESGFTFGDFPLQPVGRAKDLMDEVPDSADFFKNGPLLRDVGTLVGEYYRRHDKDVGKLGHLKEILSRDAENP
jgi:MoaA/NifB/PqqE/SkfB family radical SAM enzyme